MKKGQRRIWGWVLGAVALVFLALLFWRLINWSTPISQEKMIAATVFPVYDLTRAVAGADVKVSLILKPGSDPHSFDLSPQNLQTLARARAIFAIGHGLDDWINQAATQAVPAPVIRLDKNVRLLASLETNKKTLGDDFDPHYWLSLTNAAGMTQQIAGELSSLWPEDADKFNLRAEKLATDLLADRDQYQRQFAGQNIQIATFHNAFQYLAADLGFTVTTSFEEFSGVSPSPAWLNLFSQKVKRDKLKVIYAEPQFSTAALRPIADDLQVKIATLDPAEGVIGETTLREIIKNDVQTILDNAK